MLFAVSVFAEIAMPRNSIRPAALSLCVWSCFCVRRFLPPLISHASEYVCGMRGRYRGEEWKVWREKVVDSNYGFFRDNSGHPEVARWKVLVTPNDSLKLARKSNDIAEFSEGNDKVEFLWTGYEQSFSCVNLSKVEFLCRCSNKFSSISETYRLTFGATPNWLTVGTSWNDWSLLDSFCLTELFHWVPCFLKSDDFWLTHTIL